MSCLLQSKTLNVGKVRGGISQEFMGRIIFLVIILAGCQFGITQDNILVQDAQVPTIEEFKAQVNFAQWPGRNAPMRVPVELDKQMFPALRNSETIWARKHYNKIFKPIVVVHHKYRWRVSPGNELYIRIAVAASCQEAHEYLVNRFFNCSTPFRARVKRARRTDILKLGHICFANGVKKKNTFGTIAFIRNNIVVEIQPVGDELRREVRAIAETIDKLLLKQPEGAAGFTYYNREIRERQRHPSKQIKH